MASRLTGRRWLGGVVAMLLFFLPYLATGVGGITSGYIDFPLGALYMTVIGYLVLYEMTGDMIYFRSYAATLALLPWLKREGAILWLIAALCGFAIIMVQKRNRRLLLALAPGGLIVLLWNLCLRVLGANPPHDFVSATPLAVTTHLYRLWPIGHAVLTELGQTRHWSVFWWLLALALCYLLFRGSDRGSILLAVAIVMPLGLYSCIYLFSTWPSYLGHLQGSFARLMLQLTPLGCLVIARAVSLSWRRACPVGTE